MSDINSSLMDGITQAIKASPPLAQNPGLAVPAGASPDPVGTAQAIGLTTQVNGIQAAVAQHHHRGLFGDLKSLWTDVTHGHAMDAIHAAVDSIKAGTADLFPVLNLGLQNAQHEYRYLHDVEARHGPLVAVGEGLGILGAGAITAYFAPELLPEEMTAVGAATAAATAGGTIGAETVGYGLGHALYRDSWDRTADGTKYLDPNTHQPVSIGRDFASGLLGEKPGSATFKWVSGITDGISDLALDPLSKAGSVAGVARLARVTALTGNDVARLADTVPKVSRFVDDATHMNPGELTAKYPKFFAGDVATRRVGDKYVSLPEETLAHQLGAATTRDQVIQVLRDRVDSQLLSKGVIPHLGLSAIPYNALRQWAAGGSRLAEVTGAGKLARGQQLLPQAFDPNTLKYTTREVDPFSGQAGVMIYRWLKGNGQTEQAAKDVATNFHNATTYTDRIRIWRSAQFSALKALAMRKGLSPDEVDVLTDDEIQRRLAGEFKQITGGEFPGATGEYGYDHTGTLIPPVTDLDGAVRQAAVLGNQIGKISFPSMDEMRAAAAYLANARNLYGRADRWVYSKVTRDFFKRWVLATPSFALHVSLSEVALNALRLGLKPLLEARLAASLAKGLGDDATREALGSVAAQNSIAARMWHMMDGKVGNARMAKYAYEAVHISSDHGTVALANKAAHSIEWEDGQPQEVASYIIRDGLRKVKEIGTDRFGGFAAGSGRSHDFTRAWQQTLNQITKDPASVEAAKAFRDSLNSGRTVDEAHTAGANAARDWLNAHPELHPLYERANLPTQGWEHMAPVDAFAHAKVLNLRGHVTGNMGTVHNDLLDAIIRGGGHKTVELPSDITRDHLDQIVDKPGKVLGRIYMPDSTSALERVADNIHGRLGAVIDFISREPTYLANYAKYRRRFEPLIADGRLSEEDAITASSVWAAQDMIRFVHNLNERTQLSELVRNFAPFWFAQQQAYKRVGRLLAEDPGAFRRYQLLVTGLHTTASAQTDASGNNYMSFPGLGFISSGTLGILGRVGLAPLSSIPVNWSGSLDSVSYILPGAQPFHLDPGPIVAIPGKLIASMFPEATPLAATVIGGGSASQGDMTLSGSWWRQLVPNSVVYRFVEAAGINHRAFSSTMMSVIQNLDYQQNQQETAWIKAGRKGTDPAQDPGRWIVPPPNASDYAKQQFIDRVKNQTRIMYIVKAAMGLISPLSPQMKVNDFGFPTEVQAAISKSGSVTAGVDVFLKAHPDATPYTVFQSKGTTGFPLPDSQQAENWVNSHLGLIHQYQYGAMWLMPQLTDTKYNATVYNEQLAQGLRQKLGARQYLDALYIAAGNQQFWNIDRPIYEAATASGTYDPSTLRSEWNAYIQNFGQQNPVWYDDFKSQDRTTRRMQTIDELRQIITSGVTSPMTAGLTRLLQDWDSYQTALVNKVDTATNLADQFKSYLDGMAKDHPELSPFILSVLRPLASGAQYQTGQTQLAGAAP